VDRVDDYLQQWRRERPDLDVSAMGVHGRIKRAAELLGKVQQDYFEDQGLTRSEFDVLATLRRSGPPYELSPKELKAATMSSAATVTNRLNALETRHLLTRRTDPQNRREVIVTLTAVGSALVDEVIRGHLATEERQLHALSREERDTLASLLARLLAANGDASTQER